MYEEETAPAHNYTTDQLSTPIIRPPLAQIHQRPWKKLRGCGSSYGKNSAYAKRSNDDVKLLKDAPSRNNDDAKQPKKVTSLTKEGALKPNRKSRATVDEETGHPPAHRDFVDWLARFSKPLNCRIRHHAATARCVG